MDGQRKNNPLAKQLSDRLWQQKIVKNEKVYNRKTKHKDIKDTNHVVYRKSRPRG
jgi:stalled ribosome alternative rescue factor ArfA